ncbi:MAG: hypothetical protein ABI240_05585 [Sphingomonas sp.]
MTYQSEYAEQAAEQCRLGATDRELAEYFEIEISTFYRWRNRYSEFAEAVIAGREHADSRVGRGLYRRAVGCGVEAVKIFKHAGDAKPVYAHYRHEFPPDTNAALQWLRVRQPKKWIVREVKDESPTPIQMIELALARKAAREQAPNP